MIKTWLRKIWNSNDTSDLQLEQELDSFNDPPKERTMAGNSEANLINQETIEQIIKDTSLEVLPMLIESYLEESELRTQNIVNAIDADDYQTLEFETHTLGSTSLAMGATALGLLARKMEASCLNGEPQEALPFRNELEELSKTSREALLAIQTRLQQG